MLVLDVFENVRTQFVTGPTSYRVAFESEDFYAAQEACHYHREKYELAVVSTGVTKAIRDGGCVHVFTLVLCRFTMEGSYGQSQRRDSAAEATDERR